MPSRTSDLRNLACRFEITDLLEEDAGTYLYKAREKTSAKKVLLKCSKCHLSLEPNESKLSNYFKIASELAGEFVLPVLDFYQVGTLQVLVLEDLGSGSLRQFAEQKLYNDFANGGAKAQYLPAFLLTLKIAQAIAYLVDEGIVHGNLNPESIWVNMSFGALHVIDFSYSKKNGVSDGFKFRDEVHVSGAQYIAPEVSRSQPSNITFQSDIYSLGSLLQYLLGIKARRHEGSVGHYQLADGYPRCFTEDVDLSEPGGLLLKTLMTKLKHVDVDRRYSDSTSLIKDLKHCIDWLSVSDNSSEITSSLPVEQHVFAVSDDLFGRDKELRILNRMYESIQSSPSDPASFGVVKICGGAGMGKTVLVNKFASWARSRGSIVAQGTFAQYRKGEPLSACVDAFNDLLLQILAEPISVQTFWQKKIEEKMHGQSGVIQDLLPPLIELVGLQPKVAPISGEPAAQRLTAALLHFLNAFEQISSPLVLILDDCHWADNSSVKLITSICASVDHNKLFLLLLYRDENPKEIEGSLLWLDQLEVKGPFTQRIELNSLAVSDIGNIVAKTLGCSAAKAAPLSSLVTQRTGGDPFYVNQLLHSLHREGQIVFSENDNCWTCDLSAVKREFSAESIDIFMSSRLLELSSEALEVLQAMACLGSSVDLQTLSNCLGIDRLPLARTLRSAMNSELVVLHRDVYKFQYSANDENTWDEFSLLYGEELEFCLVHDRVRQAAYKLIPDADRAAFHSSLGRRLLEHYERGSNDRSLFNMLDKLGSGFSYLETGQERQAVAALCQQAGVRARAFIAYEESLGYFQNGIEALGAGGVQLDRNSYVNLHLEAAASALMASKFNRAFTLLRDIECLLEAPLEILHHAMLKVQLCCLVNKLEDALEVGYQSLEKVGFKRIGNEKLPETLKGISLIETQQLERDAVLSDQIALMLLLSMTPAAFYTTATAYRKLVVMQMRFCLDRGASANATLAICNFGTLYLSENNISHAFTVFDQTQGIELRFPDKEVISHKDIFYNSFYRHWRDPLHDIVNDCERLTQQCIESGDYLFASYSAIFTAEKKLFSCKKLKDFEKIAANYTKYTTQVLHQVPNFQISVWHQFTINLMDGNVDVCELEGEAFSERESLLLLEENNNEMVLFYLYFCKSLLGLHFDRPVAADRNIRKAKETLQSCAATYCGAVLQILEIIIAHRSGDRVAAASLFSDYRSNTNSSDEAYNTNFGHYNLFLLANEAGSLNKVELALELFDQAIERAQHRGMIHDALLFKEQLAYFCAEKDRSAQAHAILEQVQKEYKCWGATAKAEHLRRKCARRE